MTDAELRQLFEEHRAARAGPSPDAAARWVEDLLRILFPQRRRRPVQGYPAFRERWQRSRAALGTLLDPLGERLPKECRALVEEFAAAVPDLRAALLEDALAICQEDPAAVDRDEVVRVYPGFLAIAIYRVAHHFHARGVPVLPRILTEHAHARTGVDIHPGAVIGPRFCIDHGTGIVVGETTLIGAHVKLYQGVTLGALSVQKELARTKRHPTVEDNVVIYANATILGGETVVGRGSLIGGSAWLLKSVPPHSRVFAEPGTVVVERGSRGG